ncbi:MAG: 23S rRNA (adenine(2503)-C(2))-methyltransferase RlmN [Vicinamibacteria bacterium]|nr:23S rRNA (adenine(2503)-C(2))-methyltransferase RlmN [Vicinamibacteria bacterium]
MIGEASPPPVAGSDLFGLDRDRLAALVAAMDQPPYRAQQIYEWLYRRLVPSIEGMTDLPRSLRRRLSEDFSLSRTDPIERLVARDGTIKYLIELSDGVMVESVLIPEPRRWTLCLSTQAGCPLCCAFCLTGRHGFRRNLTAAEILMQAATAVADMRGIERPWNVVIMGMGEPLLNLEATRRAMLILMDPEGFGVPPRRLTLSTAGVLPALERLLEEPRLPNLAISLHAPRTDLRRALMPIEARFPIKDVLAVARRYPIPRGGRLTFEYVLIKGVNDSPREARELIGLLKGIRGKVNLMPLNPAPEIPFQPSSPGTVDAFGRLLAEAGMTVVVRRPRGQDICAACGQLHATRRSSSQKPH